MNKISENFKRYFFAFTLIILCGLGYILFIYLIKTSSENLLIISLQKLLHIFLVLFAALPIILLILLIGVFITDYLFPNRLARFKTIRILLIVMLGVIGCLFWAVGPGILWVIGETLLSKIFDLL